MADISVIKKALNEVDKGKELAIITITKAEGSAPRGVGTTMAVLEDGSIIGTIGGGAFENRAIELGIEAIKEGKSKSVDFPLSTEGVEMICGGAVEIFIDVYASKDKLLIVGAGHVGHAIYKAASLLDFDIVVFDDREEFLNKERFPLAKELVLGISNEELKKYQVNEKTYIVIVSRSHEFDEESLEEVVNSDAKYIGTMGSKNKVITILRNLIEKGCKKENLDRVYAPIGLDIASGKPEEIAISIISEILLVKNNGNLKHMKSTVERKSL